MGKDLGRTHEMGGVVVSGLRMGFPEALGLWHGTQHITPGQKSHGLQVMAV